MYKLHGVSIINVYNGSQYQLLCAVYPDYEWLPWKFSRLPKRFNFNSENKKKVLDTLKKELTIKEKNDWNRVKYEVKY